MTEKIKIITAVEGKAYELEVNEEQSKELGDLGIFCAWQGCRSRYKGELPAGWRMIAVFKDDSSIYSVLHGEIDGCLCPLHVKELGKYLKMGFKLDLAADESNRDAN